MSSESQQQEWTVRLTEGLRRRLALLTGTKALLCAGQKLGEVHLVKVAEAHNAALTSERERQDAVLSKTYELHTAELERIKADYTRELNAKLEQINKQAETIRDERRHPSYNTVLEALDILTKAYDEVGQPNTLVSLATKAAEAKRELLSALAAIEKHNESNPTHFGCYSIKHDLSILHEHDAELIERERQKYIIALRNYEAKHDAEVLVDAMDLALNYLPRKAEQSRQILKDALAKVKELD